MSAAGSTPRNLSQQRCFNHIQREAVARCVECSQFFCRECVAEHDDRMVCAACLVKLAHRPKPARRRMAGFFRLAQCALGVMLLWLFFYAAGETLLSIPTAFHEGTLWRSNWLDTP
jgi:hypothetical protein